MRTAKGAIMEEIIKTQIHKLRKNGMGLRTIAKYTKQPLASVQYQANKVTPPKEAGRGDP